GLYALGTGLLYFSFVQILFGALVAGIDAGQAYNEWPLMGGQIIPPTAFDLQPVWRNFFENEGMVQFVHRMTAYALFIFGVYVWWRSRRSGNARTKFAFNAVMAVLFLQMLVGIMTVLYGAPWQIAIFHQLSAVVLFALIMWGRFLARYPRMQSVRS
ncbi:MAG: COX15/CtaA family protein, partial [Pseudomonadota bacterium]